MMKKMMNTVNGNTRFRNMFATLAAGVAAACLTIASPAMAQDVVVRAGKLYIGNGQVIENGAVHIRDGRIVAVGASITVPGGATVIELRSGTITPGLIDANALLEPDDLISREEAIARPRAEEEVRAEAFESFLKELREQVTGEAHDDHEGHDHGDLTSNWVPCPNPAIHDTIDENEVCPLCARPPVNVCTHCGAFVTAAEEAAVEFASGVQTNFSRTESSDEIVPHTRVLDSVNLRSPDFKRLVAGGITTVFAAPDTAAVIGPRGAILQTAGPIRSRIIRPEDAVQFVFGTDSFRIGGGNQQPFGNFVSVRTRRPNSRMGVVWVFTKAMTDTQKAMEGQSVFGIDVPEAPALDVLGAVLKKEIPVRVHARTLTDITIALEKCREYGLTNVTLLEATEAHKVADLLDEASVPVVFGPLTVTGRELINRGETDDFRLTTPRTLLDRGIATALTARHLREEDGLARQAMVAMRGGLTRAEALAAVTMTPARMLGIEGEVGSLEAGKRGDVVVWSGEPFDALSEPAVVIVGGRVALDRRENRN